MKKNKIGKIILIIFLSLIIVGVSYIASYYLDKTFKYYGNVKLKVTFDDTETYVIPSILESTKEDALKSWPYMFTIENKGTRKGLYQIIIKDMETSTIERTNLKYVLMLDDKEVATGDLSSITDDILYTSEVDKNKSQRYKLYIWVETDENLDDESTDDSEIKEDIYEYQLSLNAIKEGGPGF